MCGAIKQLQEVWRSIFLRFGEIWQRIRSSFLSSLVSGGVFELLLENPGREKACVDQILNNFKRYEEVISEGLGRLSKGFREMCLALSRNILHCLS